MGSHCDTVVTEGDPASSLAHRRLLLVDFWRGAALLMIFINHIPDNWLSNFTLRHMGFADSTEIFVFLAGVSAALAFGKSFDRGGWTGMLLHTGRRLWLLFVAHILLVFALSSMIAAAGFLTDSAPIMEQLNFSPLFFETDVAILRLLKLNYMPSMTDILPLYIVFIACFPVAQAFMRVSPYLALAASGGLWLYANIGDVNFANYPEGQRWFFNPLAWQFLFVGGAVAYRLRARLISLTASRRLTGLAALFLMISFAAAAPWTHFPVWADARVVPPEWLRYDDKVNLSLLRLLHFGALALLAVRLLPESTGFLRSRAAHMIMLCGRHSLAIFCLGSILALAVHIFLRISPQGPLALFFLNAGGIACLLAFAWLRQKALDYTASLKRGNALA